VAAESSIGLHYTQDVAATPTGLLSFAEFERLPDSRVGKQELRHGELATMPPAKLLQYDAQRRIRKLLEAAFGEGWEIDIEMAFRPGGERDCWIADVAAVDAVRYRRDRDSGYIQGAPELVVEVLSPSNTVTEMLDRRDVCLNSGAREFWVVDPVRSSVEVFSPEGRGASYKLGQSIPLFVGGTLPIDQVFQ